MGKETMTIQIQDVPGGKYCSGGDSRTKNKKNYHMNVGSETPSF